VNESNDTNQPPASPSVPPSGGMRGDRAASAAMGRSASRASGSSARTGQRSGSGQRSNSTHRRPSSRQWWQRKRRYPMPLTEREESMRTWLFRLLILLAAFACGPLVFWTPAGMRALPALAFTGFLYMMLIRSTRQGMILTIIYLSFVGGVRRWLIPILGWADQDPLLLVGSMLTLLYFFNLALTRRVHRDTTLSRLLLWLLLVMFLEIFNPLQGGIGVGLGGIIFVIVPVLWYYFGRSFADESVLNVVLMTAVGISIVGALYGLYQTWFGFLPSEMAWIKMSATSYGALYISNTVFHAFAFFSSAQEYGQMLCLGIVILWAAALRGFRIALAPIPLLAWAVFLESTRSSVVMTLAVCVVLWAVQGRTWAFWAPRLAVAAVLAVFGLSSGLNKAQESKFDDRTQALIDHQVNGLLKPMDTKTSTASSHLGMIGIGIRNGFTTPVGQGLGSTSIAGNKLGGETRSTEFDISDSFTGLGFAGGLLYVAVVITSLSIAVRYWRITRSLTALALLGVLLINLGQWDHGGLYALSMITWVCIGGLDRAMRRHVLLEKARQAEAIMGPIPQAVAG
jgi:hypothetical protein